MDYLTCGRCLREFPLQRITTFIQHKKLDCDDLDTENWPLADPELQCSSCPQGFMTAVGLLKHAQISHNLRIFLQSASRMWQDHISRDTGSFTLKEQPGIVKQSPPLQVQEKLVKATIVPIQKRSENHVAVATGMLASNVAMTTRGLTPIERSTQEGIGSIILSATTSGQQKCSTEDTGGKHSERTVEAGIPNKMLEHQPSPPDDTDFKQEKDIVTGLCNSKPDKNSQPSRIVTRMVTVPLVVNKTAVQCVNIDSDDTTTPVLTGSQFLNCSDVGSENQSVCSSEVKQSFSSDMSSSTVDSDTGIGIPVTGKLMEDQGSNNGVQLGTGVIRVAGDLNAIKVLQPASVGMKDSSVNDTTVFQVEDSNQAASIASMESDVAETLATMTSCEAMDIGKDEVAVGPERVKSIKSVDTDSVLSDITGAKCCGNQKCGVTIIPGSHENLQKCCNAVVPKKRKRHFETKHMAFSRSSRFNRRRTYSGADSRHLLGAGYFSRFGKQAASLGSSTKPSLLGNIKSSAAGTIYIDVEPESILSSNHGMSDGLKSEENGGNNPDANGHLISDQNGEKGVNSSLDNFQVKSHSVILKPGAVFSIPLTYTFPTASSSTTSILIPKPLVSATTVSQKIVSVTGKSVSGRNQVSQQLKEKAKGDNHDIPRESSERIEMEAFKTDFQEVLEADGKGGVIRRRRYPTSKPFKCDLCELAFNQRIHLKKHMCKHTGVKPYKCQQCDYSTVERSHLKVHIRIHTGEKPFKCTYCEYATAQNSTLKIHLKRHHGGRMFDCKFCGKKFTQRQQLQNHEMDHKQGLLQPANHQPVILIQAADENHNAQQPANQAKDGIPPSTNQRTVITQAAKDVIPQVKNQIAGVTGVTNQSAQSTVQTLLSVTHSTGQIAGLTGVASQSAQTTSQTLPSMTQSTNQISGLSQVANQSAQTLPSMTQSTNQISGLSQVANQSAQTLPSMTQSTNQISGLSQVANQSAQTLPSMTQSTNQISGLSQVASQPPQVITSAETLLSMTQTGRSEVWRAQTSQKLDEEIHDETTVIVQQK